MHNYLKNILLSQKLILSLILQFLSLAQISVTVLI